MTSRELLSQEPYEPEGCEKLHKQQRACRQAQQQQASGQYDQQTHHNETSDAFLVASLATEASATAAASAARAAPSVPLIVVRPPPPDLPTPVRKAQHKIDSPVYSFRVTTNVAAPATPSAIHTAVLASTEVRSARAMPAAARESGIETSLATQLQWIREALILLRRIDDPQHVQLQRRKKLASAPPAPAFSSVLQTAGGANAQDDAADLTAASACWPGAQKAGQDHPSRSNRLLYVVWIGPGGGPWGGRSDTWLQHKRCVYNLEDIDKTRENCKLASTFSSPDA